MSGAVAEDFAVFLEGLSDLELVMMVHALRGCPEDAEHLRLALLELRKRRK